MWSSRGFRLYIGVGVVGCGEDETLGSLWPLVISPCSWGKAECNVSCPVWLGNSIIIV